jgi:hypothetical protein
MSAGRRGADALTAYFRGYIEMLGDLVVESTGVMGT